MRVHRRRSKEAQKSFFSKDEGIKKTLSFRASLACFRIECDNILSYSRRVKMSRVFSVEEEQAVLDLLHERYGHFLCGERFRLGGRVEPNFIQLDLFLERDDQRFRYEMYFYLSLEENHVEVSEGRDIVLDFVGYYLDEYFKHDRELLLPLDYQRYQMGEYYVYAKGDIRDPLLDKLADEIIEQGVKVRPDDPRFKGL